MCLILIFIKFETKITPAKYLISEIKILFPGEPNFSPQSKAKSSPKSEKVPKNHGFQKTMESSRELCQLQSY